MNVLIPRGATIISKMIGDNLLIKEKSAIIFEKQKLRNGIIINLNRFVDVVSGIILNISVKIQMFRSKDEDPVYR